MTGGSRLILPLVIAMLLSIPAVPARADGATETSLTIKNRRFTPAELDVAAGQKIKILIKNEDATAAEFESADLEREKAVPANNQVTITIGPLDPGAYTFFNDFDPAKSAGKIVAK
jgi:plastocyanin